MHETQRTISDWAVKTFGHSKIDVSIRRVLKEAKELELLVESGNYTHEQLADELADIFITGYRAFNNMGYQAHACIDHKMHINRGRKWKLNGDGTGQHVKEDNE